MAPTRPALAALALAAIAVAPAAHAAPPSASPQIVLYKDGVANPPAQTRKREQDLGFAAGKRYRFAVHGFAARLTPQQVSDLSDDPAVAAVVPDRPVHADAVPLAAGDTLPPGVQRIGADSATAVRGPSGAAVAVVDTGIDLSNPDLNVAAGTNCINDSAAPQDDNGHGTHVAGTIAARNDGEGVVGVAPGTQLYAVKVLGTTGAGTTSSIICGLDWVAAHAAGLGIRVVNMSLGGPGSVGPCDSDPERKAVCDLTAAGVTVVAAAGNQSQSIAGHTPAAYPEVLAVTAMIDTDGAAGGLGPSCGDLPDDVAEGFSNYPTGADLVHTVAAPGGCVLSLHLGGGTSEMSGTSMAAPHVAGAVALCIDDGGVAGPCAGMTPAQIVDEVVSTAHDGATLANGFSGDPLHPGSHNYGYLVRASVPPAAVTGGAGQIQDGGASLAGSVDPHGAAGSWWFEIGPSAGAYDTTTAPVDLAAGTGPTPVTAPVSGLDPGTTYHFRLVVRVDGWTVGGGDASFTTTGTPPPPPPDTTIDAAPPTTSATGHAEIGFSAHPADQATGFQCRLDSAAWASCTSPYVADGLADGAHRFDVRALGAGGRKDPTPATVSWTVDTTPPDTAISGYPADPTSNDSATFGLSSNDFPVTFQCHLDAEPWAACGARVTLTGLAPGQHRFEARAIDSLGLTDPTPAVFLWTILAPAAPSADAPAPNPGAGTPAPDPVAPLVPVAPGPRFAGPGRLVVTAVRVDRRHRRATVDLACRGQGPCSGTLALLAGRRRVVASGAVQLAAGRSVVRRFRLAAGSRGRISALLLT